MFPIRDHNPSRKFPFVNLLIIGITTYVFLLEITAPSLEVFISQYALIPSQVNLGILSTFLPFIYSMFLHGSWLHIISNMWFLWIFGDNIESHLGHSIYLIFYLVSGLAAGLLQFLFSLQSSIPTLGASGAVSGILGAYIVLYPRHKIDTLVFTFGGFLQQIELPASFMLGYWFVIQLLSGIGSLGFMGEGGVAWWAHIGGFAAGFLLIRFFPKKNSQSSTDLL